MSAVSQVANGGPSVSALEFVRLSFAKGTRSGQGAWHIRRDVTVFLCGERVLPGRAYQRTVRDIDDKALPTGMRCIRCLNSAGISTTDERDKRKRRSS